MTAPVASAPSVRAPRMPGNDDGDSNGGAPFASALHGALNAGRDHEVAPGPQRGAQPDKHSDQHSDRGEHRALGHDRADGPAARRVPDTRAQTPGDRGTRRAEDRDPHRTTPTTADDADSSGDPTDTTTDPAAGAGIPPVWVLPTPPTLPMTPPADVTQPTVDAGGVDSVVGTPAAGSGVAEQPLPTVPAGSPDEQLPEDTPPLPAAGPSPAAQPPATSRDPGGPVLTGATVRGTVPGPPGLTVAAAAAARRPSTVPASAPPAALPATPTDGAPAAPATPPLLPVGPPPAWVRAATAAAGPAADANPTAPTADAPTDGAAAVPDLGDTVIAAAATGDSASSDPGDTSGQDQGVPTADPSAAAIAPPALARATAVAPVAAPAAPAPPAPVAAQVAAQVVSLSQGPDATHSVTLVLHPDNLGPVHVQMTLDQGTVDLTLRGAHEHGRAALLDALPDLRRDLESAGLSCAKLDVDRDTGGSWSSRQQSAQQQAAQQQWADQSRRQPEWSEGRVRPWSRTADSGDSRQIPAPTTRSTSRGVDFRV